MKTPLVLLLTAFGVAGVPEEPVDQAAGDPPGVVVVRMVDKSPTEFAFEPSTITVQPGDTIRFVQKGQMPHNVEFTDSPAGASLDGIRIGPYLTRPDEAWEIVVDERFSAGEYPFVCTPHQFLGMKGVLQVESSVPRPASPPTHAGATR